MNLSIQEPPSLEAFKACLRQLAASAVLWSHCKYSAHTFCSVNMRTPKVAE